MLPGGARPRGCNGVIESPFFLLIRYACIDVYLILSVRCILRMMPNRQNIATLLSGRLLSVTAAALSSASVMTVLCGGGIEGDTRE